MNKMSKKIIISRLATMMISFSATQTIKAKEILK